MIQHISFVGHSKKSCEVARGAALVKLNVWIQKHKDIKIIGMQWETYTLDDADRLPFARIEIMYKTKREQHET